MWTVQRSDGTVATGWVLMPLRLFLGVTFLFAGLQKLANPAFFRSSSPASIHAQLAGAARSSPVHGLLSHLLGIAPAVGLVIALGEVAIGIAVVLGLLTRVAAIAGMALSFGLFLTVSFHASPYFTGSDIVFFFAWTPLVVGGSGAWSVDAALEARHARERASAGVPPEQQAPDLDRRAAVRKAASALTLASFAVVTAAIAAAVGRMSGASLQTSGAPQLSPPSTESPSPGSSKGTAIGLAGDVPLGGAREFTDPAQGIPAYVVRPSESSYVGFSAVCTHMGCTVGFFEPALQFRCPCHGSIFSAVTGEVLQGPAAAPLPSIPIEKSANGTLLADG